MRAISNMTIIVPCDAPETTDAVMACAEYKGPVYIRLGRAKMPTLAKKDNGFEIGKARILREGNDIGIIACGIMVKAALDAAVIIGAKTYA